MPTSLMPLGMPAVSIKLKQLIASIAMATVAIVCVLFIAIVWVLHFSSASLDKAQTAGEAKLLRSLVDDYAQSLSRSIADYSAWTELYQHINNGTWSAEWEKENLGPYVTRTFAVDSLNLVSRNGRIAYSYPLPAQSRIAERLLADKVKILNSARFAFTKEIPGEQTPVVGFVMLGGVPSLIGAVSVRDSAAMAHSNFALVAIRVLSAPALEALGQSYGIANLRAVPDSSAGIALRRPGGTISRIHLVWQPSRAGHIFSGKHFRRSLSSAFWHCLPFLPWL